MIFGDKNINFLFHVEGEKVGNLCLTYVCSIFQNNNCDNVLEGIIGCNALIPTQALKQMNTEIINGMFTLTM
jgi:hypothetical protein